MTFTIQNTRAIVGHDLSVKVSRDAKESIASVVTTLDNFQLASDTNTPPSVQYERFFHQAGTGGPGMTHTLVVTATDDAGNTQSATRIWTDPI